MGAYGFNEDKSKSPLLKMVEVKPTSSSETWASYTTRLWAALNDIPMGHIVGIYMNLTNADNGNTYAFMPPRYKDDGTMFELNTITANFVSARETGNGGYVSRSLAISSESSYVPSNVISDCYINGTDSKFFRHTGKNESAYGDGHVTCKIYYIP